MELRQYSAIIRRWWWLITSCTLLAAGGAFVVTRDLPPVYRATATIFVNQLSTPGTLTYSDALLNQQLVKTYSEMAVKPVVLDAVRQQLRLPVTTSQLARMVSAAPVPETQLLTITVEGNDPAQIRDIANTVAQVFIAQQQPYLPKDQVDSAIRIAQPALEPPHPIGPNLRLNTIMAAAAGLLLALGVAALLEYLDDTVKTETELEQFTGLPGLGTVMRLSADVGAPDQLLSDKQLRSVAAEAYRLIRLNLALASVDRPLATLLVTCAGPGEGKTTTIANLAVILAQSGKRILLVDTDLRKPSLHRVFGVDGRRGLTNLMLADLDAAESYVQATSVKGVSLLASGPIPRNPAELLTSARLAAIMDRLKTLADWVLFDSPPVLAATDAVGFAGRVDGVLLVVEAGRTRSEAARRASDLLARSGARLLGAILNKANRQASYYDYYAYRSTAAAVTANGHHRSSGWFARWRRKGRVKTP